MLLWLFFDGIHSRSTNGLNVLLRRLLFKSIILLLVSLFLFFSLLHDTTLLIDDFSATTPSLAISRVHGAADVLKYLHDNLVDAARIRLDDELTRVRLLLDQVLQEHLTQFHFLRLLFLLFFRILELLLLSLSLLRLLFLLLIVIGAFY